MEDDPDTGDTGLELLMDAELLLEPLYTGALETDDEPTLEDEPVTGATALELLLVPLYTGALETGEDDTRLPELDGVTALTGEELLRLLLVVIVDVRVTTVVY